MTSSAPGTRVISITGLSKRFGGLQAVNAVSLTIEDRQIHGLIGPNGAGKSTLFGLIAGDLRPDAGDILLHGSNVTAMELHGRARAGIARTFQLAHVFESMSVWENVLIGAERHERLGIARAILGLSGRATGAALAVEETLKLLGIAELAELPASRLTFGQQRLLATARAMAARPKLLLLDEPAAGLSSGEIDVLCNAILHVRSGGATVLLVEHNMNLVMRLCEHIAVMNLGETIAEGTPAEIKQSRVVAEAYLGDRRH
jgi:ABC-type branched-subunit amino acid transport system ATPase component